MNYTNPNTNPNRPARLVTHRPPQKPRPSFTILLIYCVALFLLTAGGSILGYQWAKYRTLQASPFAFSFLNKTDPANGQITDNQNGAGVFSPNVAVAAPEQTSNLPILDVLLLGVDERAEEQGSFNTDTLILATLNPQNRHAGMLSFSRDLWVPVPSMGENSKINTVYEMGHQQGVEGGGAQLTMDTISHFLGRPVQYYVRVNFNGFVQLVDLIDGFDIYVPKTIHDTEYPTPVYGLETFHVEAGWHHFTGEIALKYARTRHADSDYGRQRRQQDVIRAILDKIRHANMWPTLLAKLPVLSLTLRNSIETNLSIPTIIAYANFVAQSELAGIEQESIDGKYGEEGFNSLEQWVLRPDRTKVREATNRYFAQIDGKLDSTEIANLGDISWVRIAVLNGTSTRNVAARTSEILRSQGWNVISTADADRSDYQETRLIHQGVPEVILKKISQELELRPYSAYPASQVSNPPVELQIVVGNDLLPKLGMNSP